MGAFNPDAGCTLTDDLIAYWKLDEASGYRYDSIDPGTLFAGQFTSANSESLSVTDTAALSTGDIDFTIAMWVYFDTLTTSRTLLAKGTSLAGATTYEYYIRYSSGSDRIGFGIANGTDEAGPVLADSFGAPSTGAWYLIVAWHDASADTINIQINNGTVDSLSFSGGAQDTTHPFVIGRAGSTGSEYLNGRVDEVGFWKRTLTTQERTALYNGGNGLHYTALTTDFLTNLQAYWDLDEASGTRVDAHGSNDLTDNNTVTQAAGVHDGNTLTDNNTVTQAAGKVANAAQFTSANLEFLNHADSAMLSTGDIDFAFAGWVYLDSKTLAQSLLSKWASNGLEYLLYYDNVGDRFTFLLGNGTTGVVGTIAADSFGSPSTATWYFIVMWHDSGANTINIQVNNGTVDSDDTSGAVGDSATSFRLGASGGATDATTQAYLDGRLDEWGFWKRILTSQERSNLYNAGNGNTFDLNGTCTVAVTTRMFALFD